jgi:F0F1-type ATP synthase delta subunit
MNLEKEISVWAMALHLSLKDNEGSEEKIIKNLISSLDKKKYLIPAIFKKLERIVEKENKVDVYLAREADKETKEKLEEKVFKLLGKDKAVNYIIDKDLIGGFRIKTKDYLIKASIKDTLTKLKNNAYGHNS